MTVVELVATAAELRAAGLTALADWFADDGRDDTPDHASTTEAPRP